MVFFTISFRKFLLLWSTFILRNVSLLSVSLVLIYPNTFPKKDLWIPENLLLVGKTTTTSTWPDWNIPTVTKRGFRDNRNTKSRENTSRQEIIFIVLLYDTKGDRTIKYHFYPDLRLWNKVNYLTLKMIHLDSSWNFIDIYCYLKVHTTE